MPTLFHHVLIFNKTFHSVLCLCHCLCNPGLGKAENHGSHFKNQNKDNPFFRAARYISGTNKEIPGNGLGLSIAKWIMDIHHGKIEVKSVVGQGTEFINKFPID